MSLPDLIDIKDYNYELPENRIAKYPLKDRDLSKLLFYKEGEISSHIFNELPDLLNQKYSLIFNDTKVIMARLKFRKETGSEIEVFLLEPYLPSEYNLAFRQKKETIWKCLIGNAKKWKKGSLSKIININNIRVELRSSIVRIEKNYRLVSFIWDNDDISFSDIVNSAGITPIPPYLNRQAEAIDKERYQTIYSLMEGSVAAPTAGLHFTPGIISKIKEAGINRSTLTLHVGAGTFIPVKSTDVLKHDMHVEHFSISKLCIQEFLNMDKHFISVGTTSLRAMESLYWLGVKFGGKLPGHNSAFLDQWEAYHLKGNLTRKQSLQNILEYMEKNKLEQLRASTKIMILPGYRFNMTEGLLTNFHQPHSTLLLLVAALVGNDWKKIYSYALCNDYRFLSYGDTSLLLK